MSWLSLVLDTDCVHADALADALMDVGALSASIEDADAGTAAEQPQFGEPGAVTTPGWQRSRLAVLFAADTDVATCIAAAANAVGLDALPAYRIDTVAEQNWVQLTQSQFEPIRVSARLWIVPSWHQPPDPDAVCLILDPGMAFGTGSHPTTRLCLEWIEREVHPDQALNLLDYGCGSGILAIAAYRLGAARVVGVDIDTQAVRAAKDNAERNAVPASNAQFHASDAAVDGHYDLVVANILANPLKALAPALVALVAPGGRLALSGILVEQAEDMIAIYAPYIALAVADQREGWVCLSGTRTVPSGAAV